MNERAKHMTQQALKRLSDELDQGHSQALETYLKTMGRFHKYSWHNSILIHFQRPEATYVMGYRKWLTVGRFVREGEKGIMILAPMTYHKRTTGPETDDPDDNLAVGFTSVFVFDISQTDGQPLPTIGRVTGDPGKYIERLRYFAVDEDIELSYAGNLHGASGVSRGGQIVLLDSLTKAEEVAVLAHELAHELLHQHQVGVRLSKQIRECEAEAVAFTVCQAIGLDTGTAFADYIQLYRGDSELLSRSLHRIQNAATRILRYIL